ncbi:hypothetical protein DFH07DRAFT_335378 [Mycena maculata]|uniref:Uncharacterized protein n=1 Tax=Mycena maculata TaxID=230809 RepID=A0AAD7NMQ3_9AGAR|nr:hypothetical protein DFH07DRAFT_335378 [Mycena maculata]
MVHFIFGSGSMGPVDFRSSAQETVYPKSNQLQRPAIRFRSIQLRVLAITNSHDAAPMSEPAPCSIVPRSISDASSSMPPRTPTTDIFVSSSIHCARVHMNHPYSSAASFIYSNEPPLSAPQHPYPLPTPTVPPTLHDCGWPIPPTTGLGADSAPARRLGRSQSGPLRPLPAPITPPYQKSALVPEPKSEWVDEADDPETPEGTGTLVIAPVRAPRVKFQTPAIRHQGDDDDDVLSVRRPPPVPYEIRASERALAARRHALWRKKIIDIMCL